MAPSLRGRLVCFYCGCRSAQTRRANISRWQCEKCEAVNHLDENGEITDPPADESYATARYTQQAQRPTSPVFDGQEATLFCQTCLKNQHIFSESLASYFPAPDAPNYADYEKQYPRFRKELEERYPQVCGECEPRVQQRIRATGYAAKTDHLRRMMQRTRGGRIPRVESGWKSIVVFMGGTAWFLSMVGQVAWDGLALVTSEKGVGGLIDEDMSSLRSTCLHQAMRGSALSSSCHRLMDPVAQFALLLGVLSLWWNPRLQERLNRIGGRIVGKQEYYTLQSILLAGRYLVWLLLSRLSDNESSLQTAAGIHCALLFVGGMLTVMSFRAISIDYTPRVSFQENPEPLTSRTAQPGTTGRGPETLNGPLFQPKPYSATSNSGIRPFSISDLAPASGQHNMSPYQHPYQPPTPPPEEGDHEAMDWTPSQKATLRPATLYRPVSSANQSTPFRGHLPPDVVSMEHRLRNPPNKPTFRKASESVKQIFFRTPKRNAYQDLDNISDAGTEYEASLAETVSPAFADPKFRFQPNDPMDTGLERLLANTFSLDDEPLEVRALHQTQANTQALEGGRPLSTGSIARWHRLPVLALIAASYLIWIDTLEPPFVTHQVKLRPVSLVIVALASVRSLGLVYRQGTAYRSGIDVVIFVTELLTSIAIAFTMGESPAGSFVTANRESLDTIGSILIAVMAIQELCLLCGDLTTARENNVPPNPSARNAIPIEARAEAPSSQLQPLRRKNESSAATPASSRTIELRSESTQRTTRSKARESNGAITGNGFRGLSLGDDNGIGSLSLGQPRRNNRKGMW